MSIQQQLSIAYSSQFRVLIIETDADVFRLWTQTLKEEQPVWSVTWAISEAEAQDLLFNTFIEGQKFDLIVSKDEFQEFNQRRDVQEVLVIVQKTFRFS